MKTTTTNEDFKSFDMTIPFESEEEATKLYVLLDNPTIVNALGYEYCLELRANLAKYNSWTHGMMVEYMVEHFQDELKELLKPKCYAFFDSLGNELKVGDEVVVSDIQIPENKRLPRTEKYFAGMDGDLYRASAYTTAHCYVHAVKV